jgi:hypothetical protein
MKKKAVYVTTKEFASLTGEPIKEVTALRFGAHMVLDHKEFKEQGGHGLPLWDFGTHASWKGLMRRKFVSVREFNKIKRGMERDLNL